MDEWKQDMKWMARRIFLRSHGDMERALLEVVLPFLKGATTEGVTDWYCSGKSDDGRPSVRVYLGLPDESEMSSILDGLRACRSAKEYVTDCEKEPTPPATKPNLCHIQCACKLAFALLEQFPQTNREADPAFLAELTMKGRALHASTVAQAADDREEVVHFLANVLGLADPGVWNAVASP